MYINNKNLSQNTYEDHDLHIKMAEGSIINQSEIEGNTTVDKYSCVNRCEIERYFGLGCFSYVNNAHIGRFCTFGARVSIGAFSHPTNWLSIHEFQYRDTINIYGESIFTNNLNVAPKNPLLKIGNDVWVGDNASIKYGLTIGTGAIIGLGAVVTKNIPPYAIVGGNPAKVIRYRFNEDIIRRLLSSEWWNMSISELASIKFSNIDSALDEIELIKKAKL